VTSSSPPRFTLAGLAGQGPSPLLDEDKSAAPAASTPRMFAPPPPEVKRPVVKAGAGRRDIRRAIARASAATDTESKKSLPPLSAIQRQINARLV
jgi:hypothetical protein